MFHILLIFLIYLKSMIFRKKYYKCYVIELTIFWYKHFLGFVAVRNSYVIYCTINEFLSSIEKKESHSDVLVTRQTTKARKSS